MKRILYAIHYPVFGGPHNQALRLDVPLKTRGYETVVVLPDERGNAAQRLQAAGVSVRTMRLHRLRATFHPMIHWRMMSSMPREIAELRALIRTEQISLVQIGGLVNPQAAIAANLEGIPVVWQLLDTRAPRVISAFSMMLVRALADVVLSTGMAVARAHPGYSKIADRVIPYFPPVDLGRFAPQPEARVTTRADWGVSEADIVVGCVANINPQKGIVQLVEAFGRARSASPTSKLVLVGAEHATHIDYSAEVRRRMHSHGLVEGRDVIFGGAREDIERQLAGMDIFALTAAPRSEGITTSLLEAMATGLPSAVTDVGGLREVVQHGETGYIYRHDDVPGFVRGLRQLMMDASLRVAMGAKALLVARVSFGTESCADIHVNAYHRALSDRTP